MANLKLLRKKVLITGANGLLGQRLVQTFGKEFEVHGTGIKDHADVLFENYEYWRCDITNRKNMMALVKELHPSFVINAAAYTNVDASEEDREACWKVNVKGVENLAAAAKVVGAFMVQISTDYVFDGKEGNYTEKSKPNPLGYYGKSKLAGENVLIGDGVKFAIARTMVLYGTGKNQKLNFATWLVQELGKGRSVNIVDDQFGHPTLADDLALAILKIVKQRNAGIYHVAGSECDSRYHFALKLAEIFDFDLNLIRPINTAELNQKAPRPLNSSFILDKLHNEVGFKLSDIENGLKKLKVQLESDKH